MLRREVIKMGGGLFGLGKPSPSRFPYAGRPQPAPGIGPSQGQVVRARQVIVSGTGAGTGVFIYNGTPALGNKPIAWMTSGLVDPFGNVLPVSGIVSFFAGSGAYAKLLAGQLSLFNGTDFTPSALDGTGAGTLTIGSASETNVDSNAVMRLQSKAANGGTFPLVSLLNGTSLQIGPGSPSSLTVTGQVTATGGTPASPTLITTGSWTPITSFGANFTASGSRPPAYLLTASGEVKLRGVVNLTAAQVSGAVMFTLPFAFTLAMFYVTPNTLSGAVLDGNVIEIATNGQVSIQAAGSNGNVVTLDNAGNWTI